MKTGKSLAMRFPTITTFQGYANTFAVLESYPMTEEWRLAQYIQTCIIAYRDNDLNTIIPYDLFFVDSDFRVLSTKWHGHILQKLDLCPFLDVSSIPFNLILDSKIPLYKWIINAIDRDMYCYLPVNTEKIASYKIALQKKKTHDIFIYGYNEASEEFLFADFINVEGVIENHSIKYSFAKCSFSELENAFRSMLEDGDHTWGKLNMIRIKDYKYKMSVDYVRTSIVDYLHPDIRKKEGFIQYMYENNNPPPNLMIFLGVEVYDFLVLKIKEAVDKKDTVDYRLFHGFFDHKKLMVKRIEFMLEKNYLSDQVVLMLEQYRSVEKSALIIRNLVIKYNMTFNREILEKIILKLSSLRETEAAILEQMFCSGK